MTGQPTGQQGVALPAQGQARQQHYPRAYERPCAIALLTQINSHYGNKPLDDVQVDNFINEIDHTIKAEEARRVIVEFFRTHSTRDTWLSTYDINQMVRKQRLSRVPSPAEISRMMDGYGITDAKTEWGFRRGLTYALANGASNERALEYAKKHCDDIKTISNSPDQYPQLTSKPTGDEQVEGVTSFATLLEGFKEKLSDNPPAPDNPTADSQTMENK